jgi:hypothetical protein
MKCFQFPGILLFMAYLFLLSCDKTQPETVADLPPDPETARIEGELRLMNLSQDAKAHTLKFGDENAFMKMENVPTQATQIHERTFYICPALGKPRLLLVGKIRVEVCYESPSKMSSEISQNPDSNPQ